MRLSSAFGIFAALVSGTASAADSPPDAKAAARQGYQQVRLAYEQLTTCQRYSRGIALAVDASQDHAQAVAAAQFGPAERDTLRSLPKPAAVPCESPEGQRAKLLSHERAFEYLSRLTFMRQAIGMTGWSENLADIPAQPASLEALRQQLGQNLAAVHGVQAIDAFSRKVGAETELELALLCESRKSRPSKGPRVCPAPPAAQVQFRPLATARIEIIEWLAGALAEKGQNPFGDPYVRRGGSGPATPLGSFSATDSFDQALSGAFGSTGSEFVPCASGDAVLYLEDPSAVISGTTITLPLRNFATGAPVGKVTIDRPKSNYEQAVFPTGGNGVEKFTRCPPVAP
ncbi:MAG: hypothetical protein ACOVQY_13155 [Erythrobacter sp.]